MPKKPKTAPKQNVVKRTIYFYKIRLPNDEDGNPIDFDYNNTSKTIGALSATGNRERYQAEPDGNEVCAWVDGSKRIHIVFFNDNVVGAESNPWGPRMARFAYYLQDKCPQSCTRIELKCCLGLMLRSN